MSGDSAGTAVVGEVHVAVAVIIRHGKVLIARRPGHLHQGGLLEFPGGKVEAGETVQQALVREIAEETGLTVAESALEPVIGIHHDYGDKRVFLDVWQATESQGQAEGREGQPISWLQPDSMRDEDFPAGNRAIIRALKLPRQLAITGPMGGSDGLYPSVRQLTRALQVQPVPFVILRAPDFESDAYQQLVQAALPVCSQFGTGLIAHGSPAAFLEGVGLAGLHLNWREAARLTSRPVAGNVWFGVSCHNPEQIAHAALLGADYVTLGPVRPTRSHPDAPGIGWQAFRACVTQAPMPVYGLGGLTGDDVQKARQEGGQGIAGIGYWWHEC